MDHTRLISDMIADTAGRILYSAGFNIDTITTEDVMQILRYLEDCREEGQAIYPDILVTTNLKTCLAAIRPKFVVNCGAVNDKSTRFRKALKRCGPLAFDGWTIVLEVSRDGLSYGMVSVGSMTRAEGLLEQLLWARKHLAQNGTEAVNDETLSPPMTAGRSEAQPMGEDESPLASQVHLSEQESSGLTGLAAEETEPISPPTELSPRSPVDNQVSSASPQSIVPQSPSRQDEVEAQSETTPPGMASALATEETARSEEKTVAEQADEKKSSVSDNSLAASTSDETEKGEQQDQQMPPFLFFRRYGNRAISVTGPNVSDLISLTLSQELLNAREHHEKLTQIIVKDASDANGATQRLVLRLIEQSCREGHGILIGVVDLKHTKIEQIRERFPDGAYLQPILDLTPPDLDNLISLDAVQTDVQHNLLMQLAKRMVGCDLMTLFSTDGNLLGYNIYVTAPGVTEGIAGGARSRAFKALTEVTFVEAAFMASHDGQTYYHVKQNV